MRGDNVGNVPCNSKRWGRTQLGFENRGESFFGAPESTKEHQLCKTKQRLTYVGIHKRECDPIFTFSRLS